MKVHNVFALEKIMKKILLLSDAWNKGKRNFVLNVKLWKKNLKTQNIGELYFLILERSKGTSN